mmetsp:Transcript_28057/g.61129  ORF Transcript_28057/g.61129 Transcript_28057/m.61129 type:complete len:734 (+) Transcript_28057:58-2259(+)
MANSKKGNKVIFDTSGMAAPDHSEAADQVMPMKPTSSSIRRSVRSPSSRVTAPMTDSTRSVGSTSSGGSTHAPSLRDNLMRKQKDSKDPSIYYETVKVLGFGSMGSVTKVKKRSNAVGGSSRRDFVWSTHGVEGVCFSLPIIGTILRRCTGKDLGHKVKRNLFEESSPSSAMGASSRRIPSPQSSTNSRKMLRSPSSMISYAHKDIYYALKTIHIDRVTDPTFVQELLNEIDILKTLDHPNIVRPIETFNYRKNTSIVMELCEGGDLYTRDPYTEDAALRIVTSVLSAIEYMHSKGVIHRDLKYENIMFSDKSPTSEVKVIDFGLSKKYLPTDRLHDGVGTFYSMAPEVIRGDYDSKADLWSIAVIAFMLLSSQMPFYGKDQNVVIKKILSGKYRMLGRSWQKVSEEGKDFVRSLLIRDPNDRPSAGKALRHNWIGQVFSNASTHSSDQELEEMENAMASIETFADYSKLKKLALMVIAHKSTSQEIGFLRRIFDKYDKDRNGMIELAEFQEALEGFGYGEAEVEKMFAACDLDGTGIIHYTEFLAATIEAHGAINEEALAEAFDRMDSDDSGYISTHNLREMLGEFVTTEHIEEIILEAESQLNYSEHVKQQISAKPAKDHFISYEEFIALWDQQQEGKRLEALTKIEQRRFGRSPSAVVSQIPSLQTILINDDGDTEGSGSMSDLSMEADPVAISQFQGEKMMSVRKYNGDSPMSAPKYNGASMSVRNYGK